MRSVPLALSVYQAGGADYFCVGAGMTLPAGSRIPRGAPIFGGLDAIMRDAESRGAITPIVSVFYAPTPTDVTSLDCLGAVFRGGADALGYVDVPDAGGRLEVGAGGAYLSDVAACIGLRIDVAAARRLFVFEDVGIRLLLLQGCNIVIEADGTLLDVIGASDVTVQLVDCTVTVAGAGATRGRLVRTVTDGQSFARVNVIGGSNVAYDCLDCGGGTNLGAVTATVQPGATFRAQPRMLNAAGNGATVVLPTNIGSPYGLAVLSTLQLLTPSDGTLQIAGATAIGTAGGVTDYVAGDTFHLSDGTTTETYTAVAGAPGALQFQVAGTLAGTQQNLINAINANAGSLWKGAAATFSTIGLASAPWFVICRKVQAQPAYADRIWEVSGSSSVQLVFNNTTDTGTAAGTYQTIPLLRDFQGPTITGVPATDPGIATFGPAWTALPAGGALVFVLDTLASSPMFVGRSSNGVAGSWVSGAAYSPSTPADWTDPDPTTLAAAVDRLAAAVAGLLAGPIP